MHLKPPTTPLFIQHLVQTLIKDKHQSSTLLAHEGQSFRKWFHVMTSWWCNCPYSSCVLQWDWGDRRVATAPMNQPPRNGYNRPVPINTAKQIKAWIVCIMVWVFRTCITVASLGTISSSIYIYIHVHIHVHIHMFRHIHTHMYIYIYIHIYMNIFVLCYKRRWCFGCSLIKIWCIHNWV